jgi:CRP/FNR family transcriptional regulator, cyclic AMP receptor protein
MASGGDLFARFGKLCEVGDILFREGESGETMFVLQSGEVRITKDGRDGQKTLAVLGPGEFFGEMAILNAKPRNATAEVTQKARVLVIDARTFEQMVVSNAEIAVRLIKKLARRLDSANALIDVLMHRDPKARVILGLSRQVDMIGDVQPDGSVEMPLDEAALGEEIGLTAEETAEVVTRLERLRIISRIEGGIRVSNVQRLDEFLEFLEMQSKFGDP